MNDHPAPSQADEGNPNVDSALRRSAPYAIPALLLVDIVTLFIAVIVFFNQADINQRLHDGLCRGNGIVIERVRADLRQASPETYRQFFPTVSDAEIQAIITQQRATAAVQIHALQEGCTPAQLASGTS